MGDRTHLAPLLNCPCGWALAKRAFLARKGAQKKEEEKEEEIEDEEDSSTAGRVWLFVLLHFVISLTIPNAGSPKFWLDGTLALWMSS